MKIKVNGEEKKLELDQDNALLSTALNLMGYKPNTIVVELNNLTQLQLCLVYIPYG